MQNITLTSDQAKTLISKHGKITMSGIRDLLGLPKDTVKVVRKKPESKVTEMMLLLRLAGIEFETEYRFHEKRKWRLDIAIPEAKLGIEYEGIFSKKSRHTTISGYTGDIEKYNTAAKMGWTILRYTAKNYTDVVEDVLNARIVSQIVQLSMIAPKSYKCTTEKKRCVKTASKSKIRKLPV